jgi:SH3 domain protein
VSRKQQRPAAPLLAACLGLVAGQVCAETLYVTDELRLRLQETPQDSSKVIVSLTSGTPVEVLERTNFYALVRLEDGREGWAKTAYLVAEKPARLRVAELEAEIETLKSGQQPLADERDALARTKSELQGRVAGLEATAGEQQSRIATLEQARNELEARLGLDVLSFPWYWTLAALLAGGMLGAYGTNRLLDHRSRKRHGGYRIY